MLRFSDYIAKAKNKELFTESAAIFGMGIVGCIILEIFKEKK